MGEELGRKAVEKGEDKGVVGCCGRCIPDLGLSLKGLEKRHPARKLRALLRS